MKLAQVALLVLCACVTISALPSNPDEIVPETSEDIAHKVPDGEMPPVPNAPAAVEMKMPPLTLTATAAKTKTAPTPAPDTSMNNPMCDHFFGHLDELETVVDTGIFGPKASKFCGQAGLPTDKPCVFVHKAAGKCVPPAPPDMGYCHHYHKVKYSFCPLLTADASAWVGAIDADQRFDQETGVIKGCETNVVSKETFCYEAPKDSPVMCSCSK